MNGVLLNNVEWIKHLSEFSDKELQDELDRRKNLVDEVVDIPSKVFDEEKGCWSYIFPNVKVPRHSFYPYSD